MSTDLVDRLDANGRTSQWVRVSKIVAVFVIVGPLVASMVAFAGHVVEGLSNPRYLIPSGYWVLVWLSWAAFSYMICAPYALLSGGVFAILAVFGGWRQLWLAIAVALAPLTLVHLLPAMGQPIWEWESIFSVSAIVVAVVATTVCWGLSRRWLRQS